jgi:hypothetical protein
MMRVIRDGNRASTIGKTQVPAAESKRFKLTGSSQMAHPIPAPAAPSQVLISRPDSLSVNLPAAIGIPAFGSAWNPVIEARRGKVAEDLKSRWDFSDTE